jgi:hypothetical protein
VSNKFNILIPIITLIIGWFLNLFSTKVTFKKTRELEKKKLLQTKIEEIATLIDEIDQDYTQLWGKVVSIVKLGMKINAETVNTPKIPFSRVQILIDFYFPKLKTEYNELIKEKSKFGKQLVLLIDETNKTNQEGLIYEITDTSERIRKTCEEIISSSVKVAQKIL